MYNLFVIIFLAIVIIIAFIWTYKIFKDEERKLRQYEEIGATAEEELKRSHEYEKKSLLRNMKNLTWIYVITITLSLIIFAFYIYL